MNHKRHTKVWACAILLACTTLVFAQDQPNEVRCSGGGTTCTSNFLPKFASNGGSATVNDSIMSQNGTTINVAGSVISTSTGLYTVYGQNNSTTGGKGVAGFNLNGSEGFGVQGYASGSNAFGVVGTNNPFGLNAQHIRGTAPVGVIGDSANGYAIVAASDNSNALIAVNSKSGGAFADTVVISNNGPGFPLFAASPSGSMFLDNGGNLNLSGVVNAAAKDFKIDHPLDPANKYLFHTSVESSEMMNIYTGTTLMDAGGFAIVSLPDWFEAVNGDFRYQLTAISAPAPNLHIAREITNNQFVIAGGQPGMKVSWQVTGVRHDAYAKAHPLEVSVDKPEAERGYYIHPDLYGATPERSLASAHMTQVMQRAK